MNNRQMEDHLQGAAGGRPPPRGLNVQLNPAGDIDA
jgi:hypothetical protein